MPTTFMEVTLTFSSQGEVPEVSAPGRVSSSMMSVATRNHVWWGSL